MKKKTIMLIQLLLIIAGFSLTAVSCSNLFDGSDDAKKKSSYSWTVTFDGQGATAEATPTIKTVKKPAITIDALPTPPAKTGFNFAGWWSETNGGGTEFTASTQVKANLTVYANWSENPVYTVTYNSDGGTAVGEQHVTLPATTLGTLPTAPTKANHTFGGWWTAINGGGTEFTATTPVTASVTVWAKWDINFYTVIYNSDGGSSVDAQRVTYPATTIDSLPAIPTKSSYAFAGWWTAINGGGTEFTESTPVTENVNVWAKWLAESPATWFVIDGTNTLTGLSAAWTSSTDLNKNNLVIPSSVTKIGNYAFQGKTTLTSIFIPSSVTSLGQSIFENCTGFTNIIIPSSVISTGTRVFAGCTGLTDVTLSTSITSIKYETFMNCSNLTDVTIPASVTSIEGWAFQNCIGLTNLTIPALVESIAGFAFTGCTNLHTFSVDPLNIKLSFEGSVLYNKEKTAVICFLPGISSVFIIPSTVTSIQSTAFYGCAELTSVTIPSSISNIPVYTFANCANLTTVILNCSSIPTVDSTSFSGNAASRKFKVPNLMLGSYQNTGVWKTTYLSAIISQ